MIRRQLLDNERAALPRLDSPPVPTGPARGMDIFPRKYSEALEHNQRIKLCCRHMENVTGQTFKTSTANGGPDLFVATCQDCGRNHYRLLVGEQ